jgi:hypothetical protein
MVRARTTIGLVAFMSCFPPLSPLAAQKPDFSGTWVAVSPAEAAGSEENITQDATTVTRGHASSGSGHHARYTLDGSPTRNAIRSHGQEIVTISRASWDGGRLVINESTTYPDGRVRKQRSIMSLDASGQLLIDVEEMIDGQPARKLQVVMKRKA